MWFWSNMIHSFTTMCRCDFCILMLTNRNPKWKPVQWRSNTFPRASAVVTKSSRYRTWKHTRIRIYGNLLPASCTYNLFYKNKPSDLWKPLFGLHRSKLQGLICQDYPRTEKNKKIKKHIFFSFTPELWVSPCGAEMGGFLFRFKNTGTTVGDCHPFCASLEKKKLI